MRLPARRQGIIDVTVRTTPVPFDSDALRANIGRTAQKVVIPDRYVPLVDAVEGLHGVRASLTETMGEYFHTFRNADMLVEGFQTTLLRNWPYFERSEDRSSCSGSSRSWCSGCSTRRSATSSPRSCCAGCCSGARMP